MKQRLGQLKALSLHEWQLLLLASLLLLPLTALALHLGGFKRTRKMMACFLPPESGGNLPEAIYFSEARVAARMVSVAARHGVYRTNCLKQSLVLWWLLARRGIPSEIKIGVNKEGAGPLNAHAWVECGGHPLIDSDYTKQQFSAFESN